jgi:hypothetical protein
MTDATTQVTSEALTKVNRLAVVSIVWAQLSHWPALFASAWL